MHSIIYLEILFIAKVMDNAINTTKTIMIQRSRWVLAGIAVILSDFIYFWIMRNVVTSDNMLGYKSAPNKAKYPSTNNYNKSLNYNNQRDERFLDYSFKEGESL